MSQRTDRHDVRYVESHDFSYRDVPCKVEIYLKEHLCNGMSRIVRIRTEMDNDHEEIAVLKSEVVEPRNITDKIWMMVFGVQSLDSQTDEAVKEFKDRMDTFLSEQKSIRKVMGNIGQRFD